jgi:hypothetical protein
MKGNALHSEKVKKKESSRTSKPISIKLGTNQKGEGNSSLYK